MRGRAAGPSEGRRRRDIAFTEGLARFRVGQPALGSAAGYDWGAAFDQRRPFFFFFLNSALFVAFGTSFPEVGFPGISYMFSPSRSPGRSELSGVPRWLSPPAPAPWPPAEPPAEPPSSGMLQMEPEPVEVAGIPQVSAPEDMVLVGGNRLKREVKFQTILSFSLLFALQHFSNLIWECQSHISIWRGFAQMFLQLMGWCSISYTV